MIPGPRVLPLPRMTANATLLLISSPLLLLVLVRLLGLDVVWPLVPAVSFIPQVTLGLIVLAAIARIVRAYIALAVLAVVCVVMIFTVSGRVFSDGVAQVQKPESALDVDEQGKRVVPETDPFTVLSANVMIGRADIESLMRTVNEVKPDLIALQEVTPEFMQKLLAVGLGDVYPSFIDHSDWGSAGYATFARTTLTELKGSGLKVAEPVAGHAYWPEMRVAGTKLLLRNVHPQPPIMPSATRRWRDALGAIPGSGNRQRVVIGDFNATLDHRDFRALLGRGYTDVGSATGHGLESTWRAGLLRRLVIDHVLVPPSVGIESYKVIDLADSDHDAIAATLRLPR